MTKANVDLEYRESNDPDIRLLLAREGQLGQTAGISNDWAYNVIRLVGNYEDIWQSNFSRWKLKRGINALWRDGGQLLPVPVQ